MGVGMGGGKVSAPLLRIGRIWTPPKYVFNPPPFYMCSMALFELFYLLFEYLVFGKMWVIPLKLFTPPPLYLNFMMDDAHDALFLRSY